MKGEHMDEIAMQGWSDSTLRLAIKTGFQCEYCGSDFFAAIEHYYAFEVEHIVPRGRGPEIDEAPENLTVSCRTCNRLKRRWDPRSRVGDSATREQLIEAARKYVLEQRQEKFERIKQERQAALRIMARMVGDTNGPSDVSNPAVHTDAAR